MIKGIDISHHQENPDFKRVKAAGTGFVILKATEGVSYTDPCFHANIKAAQAAGLPVGAYHFLRATLIDQQCRDFLAAVKPYKPVLLAIDVENPTKDGKVISEVSNLGKAEITARVITINKAIRAAGYTCPVYVYSSKSWFGTYIDTEQCKAAGMNIWLAWYSNATPDNTDRRALCDMWQYASDGKVDGIPGHAVDLNVSYRDFAPLAFQCDTTADMVMKHGAFYQLKVTVPDGAAPQVYAGTPDVITVLPRNVVGNDHYIYLCAVGASGSGTGIFVNGVKQFAVNIK